MADVALEVRQGATYAFRVRMTSAGAPVDLTAAGWRVTWQVRPAPTASTVLWTLDSADGTLLLAADGWAVGEVTPAMTLAVTLASVSDLRPQRIGFYDLRVLTPEGAVARELRGPVFLVPAVSRPDGTDG